MTHLLQLGPLPPDAQIIAWSKDPELREYFRRHPPSHLWGHAAAAIFSGASGIYVGDECVGLAHLFNIDARNRHAEIGVMIDASKVPKRARVAVAAMRAVADYAFDYLGLNKLYAQILPHRDDLVRLLSTYGFKHEGVLRDESFFEGRFHDEIRMSLLAKTYRMQRGR